MQDYTEYREEQKESYERGRVGIVGATLGQQAQSRLPLGDQEKFINMLHESLNELRDRLGPILEPEYPSEQSETEANVREGSLIHNQISAHNQGIYGAVNIINKLIQRIEC